MTETQIRRYARHVLLPDVGGVGQERLLAATQRLIAEGRIASGDSVVVCVTGQGLKTTDPLVAELPPPPTIGARLSDFDSLISS